MLLGQTSSMKYSSTCESNSARGEGAGRKREMEMYRLHVGHTWLTQSYLLKNEEQPFCYASHSLYTVNKELDVTNIVDQATSDPAFQDFMSLLQKATPGTHLDACAEFSIPVLVDNVENDLFQSVSDHHINNDPCTDNLSCYHSRNANQEIQKVEKTLTSEKREIPQYFASETISKSPKKYVEYQRKESSTPFPEPSSLSQLSPRHELAKRDTAEHSHKDILQPHPEMDTHFSQKDQKERSASCTNFESRSLNTNLANTENKQCLVDAANKRVHSTAQAGTYSHPVENKEDETVNLHKTCRSKLVSSDHINKTESREIDCSGDHMSDLLGSQSTCDLSEDADIDVAGDECDLRIQQIDVEARNIPSSLNNFPGICNNLSTKTSHSKSKEKDFHSSCEASHETSECQNLQSNDRKNYLPSFAVPEDTSLSVFALLEKEAAALLAQKFIQSNKKDEGKSVPERMTAMSVKNNATVFLQSQQGSHCVVPASGCRRKRANPKKANILYTDCFSKRQSSKTLRRTRKKQGNKFAKNISLSPSDFVLNSLCSKRKSVRQNFLSGSVSRTEVVDSQPLTSCASDLEQKSLMSSLSNPTKNFSPENMSFDFISSKPHNTSSLIEQSLSEVAYSSQHNDFLKKDNNVSLNVHHSPKHFIQVKSRDAELKGHSNIKESLSGDHYPASQYKELSTNAMKQKPKERQAPASICNNIDIIDMCLKETLAPLVLQQNRSFISEEKETFHSKSEQINEASAIEIDAVMPASTSENHNCPQINLPIDSQALPPYLHKKSGNALSLFNFTRNKISRCHSCPILGQKNVDLKSKMALVGNTFQNQGHIMSTTATCPSKTVGAPIPNKIKMHLCKIPGRTNYTRSVSLPAFFKKEELERSHQNFSETSVSNQATSVTPKSKESVQRTIVAFHSDKSAFMPKHCQKTPTRKIAPTDISFSVPSLQDSSRSSLYSTIPVNFPASPLAACTYITQQSVHDRSYATLGSPPRVKQSEADSNSPGKLRPLVAFSSSSLPASFKDEGLVGNEPQGKSAFRPVLSSNSLTAKAQKKQAESKRTVITFHSGNLAFNPMHYQKRPSRRIAPTEVDDNVPSPLNNFQHNSVTSSVAQASLSQTMCKSPYTIVNKLGPPPDTAYPGIVDKDFSLSYSSEENCPIKHSIQNSPTNSNTHNKSQSKTAFSHQENHVTSELKTTLSIPRLDSLGIRLPLSPSKRQPKRIHLTKLCSLSDKGMPQAGGPSSRRKISSSSPSHYLDESKIVSSSSDLSASQSEAQAFKLLKSFIASSYVRPQPQQEITSTNQGDPGEIDSNCHRKKRLKKSNIRLSKGFAERHIVVVKDAAVTAERRLTSKREEEKLELEHNVHVASASTDTVGKKFKNALKSHSLLAKHSDPFQCQPRNVLCSNEKHSVKKEERLLADNKSALAQDNMTRLGSPISGSSWSSSKSFAVVGTVEYVCSDPNRTGTAKPIADMAHKTQENAQMIEINKGTSKQENVDTRYKNANGDSKQNVVTSSFSSYCPIQSLSTNSQNSGTKKCSVSPILPSQVSETNSLPLVATLVGSVLVRDHSSQSTACIKTPTCAQHENIQGFKKFSDLSVVSPQSSKVTTSLTEILEEISDSVTNTAEQTVSSQVTSSNITFQPQKVLPSPLPFPQSNAKLPMASPEQKGSNKKVRQKTIKPQGSFNMQRLSGLSSLLPDLNRQYEMENEKEKQQILAAKKGEIVYAAHNYPVILPNISKQTWDNAIPLRAHSTPITYAGTGIPLSSISSLTPESSATQSYPQTIVTQTPFMPLYAQNSERFVNQTISIGSGPSNEQANETQTKYSICSMSPTRSIMNACSQLTGQSSSPVLHSKFLPQAANIPPNGQASASKTQILQSLGDQLTTSKSLVSTTKKYSSFLPTQMQISSSKELPQVQKSSLDPSEKQAPGEVILPSSSQKSKLRVKKISVEKPVHKVAHRNHHKLHDCLRNLKDRHSPSQYKSRKFAPKVMTRRKQRLNFNDEKLQRSKTGLEKHEFGLSMLFNHKSDKLEFLESKPIVQSQRHSTWIKDIGMINKTEIETIRSAFNLNEPHQKNIDSISNLSFEGGIHLSSPETPQLTIDIQEDDHHPKPLPKTQIWFRQEKSRKNLNKIEGQKKIIHVLPSNSSVSSVSDKETSNIHPQKYDHKQVVKQRNKKEKRQTCFSDNDRNDTKQDANLLEERNDRQLLKSNKDKKNIKASTCKYISTMPLHSLQRLLSNDELSQESHKAETVCLKNLNKERGPPTNVSYSKMSQKPKRRRCKDNGETKRTGTEIPSQVQGGQFYKVKNPDKLKPNRNHSKPSKKRMENKKRKFMAKKDVKTTQQSRIDDNQDGKKQTLQKLEFSDQLLSVKDIRGDGTNNGKLSPSTESQDRQRELEHAVAVLEGCLAAEDIARHDLCSDMVPPRLPSHISPVKHLPLKKRLSFDLQSLIETSSNGPQLFPDISDFQPGQTDISQNQIDFEGSSEVQAKNNITTKTYEPEISIKSLPIHQTSGTLTETQNSERSNICQPFTEICSVSEKTSISHSQQPLKEFITESIDMNRRESLILQSSQSPDLISPGSLEIASIPKIDFEKITRGKIKALMHKLHCKK
ncbi:hypothetical protein PoB_000730300 [Plakobranchus ocellatus]|uniref:Uncharacterized protein n=1 Tax=Plakobranchus ocellatus TaxID=259542 RepID=A0AAV3YF80_9GAST|nr:hypothetical protein PoB_000730300 [Plakobranchus ocellatus]